MESADENLPSFFSELPQKTWKDHMRESYEEISGEPYPEGSPFEEAKMEYFFPVEGLPPAEPEWETWRHFRRASLKDSVALALNINPIVIGTGTWDESELLPIQGNGRTRFDKLMIIALNRIAEFQIFDENKESDIDLVKFGKFVESLGIAEYELPPEFPRSYDAVSECDRVMAARSPKRETPKTLAEEPMENDPKCPPYLTSKMLGLFKIMREVRNNPAKKAIDIIVEQTGLDARDVRVLASLINEKPDGRSTIWPCETDGEEENE